MAALAVSVLGYVTKTDDLNSLIGLGVGIGLVILALAGFTYINELVEGGKPVKKDFSDSSIDQ